MPRFQKIVVLTGAGLSAESGVSTFRDPNGIWSKYDYRDVATPEGFVRNPGMVLDFYNMRRRQGRDVQPNAAHKALAQLEAEHPGEVLVVTQNVDRLHEAAGTRNLIHMHGELLRARCTACAALRACRHDLASDHRCQACGEANVLRPHVVWFGEMPLALDAIYAALARCDLFMAIGTSGQVYPAAGFAQEVRGHGRARTIELNLEPSAVGSLFGEHRRGPAGETVPRLVEEVLGEAQRC